MAGDEELTRLSIVSLTRLTRRRRVSARETVEAYLDRIAKSNSALNAFVDLDSEGVRRRATELDEASARGAELGPLHGAPLSIKSSIDVEGLRCECGSALRRGRKAELDAPLVAALRRAGALILGVTNTPEMLMAYETDNALYGRTNNPWDLERTPGGSSGGEAAAVAGGLSAGGFGSDGGGSIRVPAHFCGVYGLKTTPGVISRTGHWPSCIGPGALLGVAGPLARSAADLDLLLRVTAGLDANDPFSVVVDVQQPRSNWLSKQRVAVAAEFKQFPVTVETRQAVARAATAFEAAGCEVEEVPLEEASAMQRCWRTLFSVSGRVLLEPTLSEQPELHALAAELFASKEEADQLSASALLQAWNERDQLRSKLLARLAPYALLLCPTASIPAFSHGARRWRFGRRSLVYPEIFIYSQIFNLTGLPAVAVPAGQSPEGLPIAVQVVAKPFEDARAVAGAELLEAAFGPFPGPSDPRNLVQRNRETGLR